MYSYAVSLCVLYNSYCTAAFPDSAESASSKPAPKGPAPKYKLQQELLGWLSLALRDFGVKLPVKMLVDTLKYAIQSSNQPVRQAAISLIGALCVHTPLLIYSYSYEYVVFYINHQQRKPTCTTGTSTCVSHNY